MRHALEMEKGRGRIPTQISKTKVKQLEVEVDGR